METTGRNQKNKSKNQYTDDVVGKRAPLIRPDENFLCDGPGSSHEYCIEVLNSDSYSNLEVGV